MRRQLLPALLLPAALLAGCSGSDDAPPDQDLSAPTSASASDGGASATPSADATVAAPPEEPIATVPGGERGMVVELYELERSGKSVTATMAVTNEAPEGFLLARQFAATAEDEYLVSGISLFDPAGLKRYLVLRDTDGNCLCSTVGLGQLEQGDRVSFTATFPAPPSDVDTVTVETPMGALPSVPIS
ncbi:hypothetical protein [Kineococcus rubinsiae]|uniref:hypothetical protein n=1 Tax=Kineococcus rubinsiae TaxID=2609562 RepID=UPI0014318131|nr:hypothetical protein [Kineococcus rubinsiae]